MKQPFQSNMRVLFLLSAFCGAAMAAEFDCDHNCVEAIYLAIAGAEAGGGGYKDGDMAVYGYLLYHGYSAAGADGFAWVGTVMEGIGQSCAAEDYDPMTRDGMADCFNGAKQEHVDEYEKAFKDVATDEKAGMDWIVGAIANQLATGSVFAEAYAGVSAEEYELALQVYYIVGAIFEVFKVVETEGVFANQEAKDACYTALGAAVEYEEGGNLVEALITNSDKIEGAFTGTSCFGSEAVEAAIGVSDNDVMVKSKGTVEAFGESLTTADANVAKFKSEQPGADADADAEEESSAAVLSAAVALLAMML